MPLPWNRELCVRTRRWNWHRRLQHPRVHAQLRAMVSRVRHVISSPTIQAEVKESPAASTRYRWVVAAVLKYNVSPLRQQRPSDPNDRG